MFAPDWMVLAFTALIAAGLVIGGILMGLHYLAGGIAEGIRALTPTARRERRELRDLRADYDRRAPERARDNARLDAYFEILNREQPELPEWERLAFKHTLSHEVNQYWAAHPDATTLPGAFADELVALHRDVGEWREREPNRSNDG
jgi:hypothetical protein